MKNLNITLNLLTLVLLSLGMSSCKDQNKEDNPEATAPEEIHQTREEEGSGQNTASNESDAVVQAYLQVKEALVNDNREAAAGAGAKLLKKLEDFDESGYDQEQQKELKDIIVDAKEHAEHISESPIDHQREHFDILSRDIIDMIAITGTGKKLYQAFCPIYNKNKGAQWLSATKEIKNPYMGAKMMSCGEVQKEYN